MPNPVEQRLQNYRHTFIWTRRAKRFFKCTGEQRLSQVLLHKMQAQYHGRRSLPQVVQHCLWGKKRRCTFRRPRLHEHPVYDRKRYAEGVKKFHLTGKDNGDCVSKMKSLYMHWVGRHRPGWSWSRDRLESSLLPKIRRPVSLLQKEKTSEV